MKLIVWEFFYLGGFVWSFIRWVFWDRGVKMKRYIIFFYFVIVFRILFVFVVFKGR